MWGFFILLTVYIRSSLTCCSEEIPHHRSSAKLGRVGLPCRTSLPPPSCGIATFAIIRILRNPGRNQFLRIAQRHWLVLVMIFNVIWTYVLVRGSAVNNGTLPTAAGLSQSARFFAPSGSPPTKSSKPQRCCCTSGSCFTFLILVCIPSTCTSSWRPCVTFKRRCRMGWAAVAKSRWQTNRLRVNEVNISRSNFTWKGMLTTVLGAGRCQSQCPAWNTGKPLSPQKPSHHGPARPLDGQGALHPGPRIPARAAGRSPRASSRAGIRVRSSARAWTGQATRPLVGTEGRGGVIDPDVLWSCVTWCLR